MDDHPIHTITNHHPTKMDILQNTFVQIIIAAKCLMRHSSTYPNQQRRPLPSLLSLSFLYVQYLCTVQDRLASYQRR